MDGAGAGAAEEEEKGDDLDVYWDQNSNKGDLEGSDASENEMEQAVENEMEEAPNEGVDREDQGALAQLIHATPVEEPLLAAPDSCEH